MRSLDDNWVLDIVDGVVVLTAGRLPAARRAAIARDSNDDELDEVVADNGNTTTVAGADEDAIAGGGGVLRASEVDSAVVDEGVDNRDDDDDDDEGNAIQIDDGRQNSRVVIHIPNRLSPPVAAATAPLIRPSAVDSLAIGVVVEDDPVANMDDHDDDRAAASQSILYARVRSLISHRSITHISSDGDNNNGTSPARTIPLFISFPLLLGSMSVLRSVLSRLSASTCICANNEE
jgi:hypothetical protein